MHNSIHSVDSAPLKIARINYEWIQMFCTYAVAVFQRNCIQRLADWCATVYRIDNANKCAWKRKASEKKNCCFCIYFWTEVYLNDFTAKCIRLFLCEIGQIKKGFQYSTWICCHFSRIKWAFLFCFSCSAFSELKFVVHKYRHQIIHRKVSSN